MVCAVSACASVRLCRSLPSFAFHLAGHVICRERASRRERDGSMQSQPGAARTRVRACRVRKYYHPTFRVRRVTARPAALTRDSRSERPLPADLGERASVPAASSVCCAYGMHASRRQQQACVGKAAAGVMCACVASVIVRSDRGHRPERLPLAARSRYLGISCMSADPRAPGCPWATAVARSSHTWRGSASLRHRCAVCTTADWARACPATRAASCTAADCGRTASTGSGCIGSIMRAPECDRSPSE
jgi:hypothetical protein